MMSSELIKSVFPSGILGRSLLATAVTISGTSYAIAQSDAQEPEKRYVVVVEDEDDAAEGQARGDAGEELPKLWLGVMLKEIHGDLATYLDSEEGVLVESVFPDSPAAEAGLKRGDILQKVGGKVLVGPSDLLAAIKAGSASEPKPLQLTVIRKNEEMQIELTPAKRPEKALHKVQVTVDTDDAEGEGSEENAFSFSFSGDLPREEMDLLLERIHKGEGKDVEMFRLGSPSMIFVPRGEDEAFSGEMEVVIKKDIDGEMLEITVNRTEDNPANITVKSGDEVEKYTEEDLDDMPQKVRVIVEPILKKNNSRMNLNKWRVGTSASAEDAQRLAEEYRIVAEKMRKDAESSAETLRAQALEAVRKARSTVESRVGGKSSEVAELKQLIDELRAEVDDLRKQLKKPE